MHPCQMERGRKGNVPVCTESSLLLGAVGAMLVRVI